MHLTKDEDVKKRPFMWHIDHIKTTEGETERRKITIKKVKLKGVNGMQMDPVPPSPSISCRSHWWSVAVDQQDDITMSL